MKLLEKIQSYFTNEKVKELEERLKKVENNSTTAVCKDPYRACVAEIKLISKTIYNVSLGSVTVVLNDGSVLEGNGLSQEKYLEIQNCTDRSCLIALLSPPKEKSKGSSNHDIEEQEVRETISSIVDVLKERDEFDVIGDKVFLKGVKSIELPSTIVAEFIRLESFKENWNEVQEEFNSLLMFSYKLLLNPVEESRKDCLQYVKNYDIKLTNTGNMIMYRRVVSVGNKDKKLVKFISKQYLKVKSWKKSPKKYAVHFGKSIGYFLMQYAKHPHDSTKDVSYVGNLAELYNNLSELKENRYTDDYTRTYDIRIGSVYKIKEKDIDTNKNGSCGGALHLADGKVFSYSSFGDTPVVCIVSPQHIYKMDSGCSGKIGVKQMFIAAITTQDEFGNYEDIDNQKIVEFDDIYHNETVEELKTAFTNKSVNEVSVGDVVSDLNLKEVLNISEILSNRVVLV